MLPLFAHDSKGVARAPGITSAPPWVGLSPRWDHPEDELKIRDLAKTTAPQTNTTHSRIVECRIPMALKLLLRDGHC